MLREIIDEFYLERERDRNRERLHFYVTDAGKCPRAIFFNFKRLPREEIGADRLRVFEHGDYIQQMILKPLFSKGLIRATEINIPPQEIISGRADAIVSINGEPYVLDVKSISGRLNMGKMDKPHQEHYYQVQLYLHYFKIKKGILLYVNKDTQELKEFVFDYDPELAERLIDWFENLKEKIESDIVPPALPDYPKNWQCSYCPYKEICKIAGPKEIRWEELKKKLEKISQNQNQGQ